MPTRGGARLVEAGIAITSELSLDAVLQTLVRIAAELTGARYSALGVIDRAATSLERFVTYGIDDADAAAIGELPRGRGDPRGADRGRRGRCGSTISPATRARSAFRPTIRRCTASSACPVMTRGVAFGNLYLAEKQPAGGFTDEDEEIVTLLAAQAAVAIENAGSVQRDALRRAVQAQEAERRRLARELHDETGQALTSILLGLAAVERAKSAEEAHAAAAELRASSSRRCRTCGGWPSSCGRRRSTTSASSRRCAASGRRCARRGALDVQVETRLGAERLPADVETALYRIVQEALTNVVKHAGAKHVSIVVTRKPTACW